ncbi:MAG: GNAT family N-acetyltransferase [Bacteroidales bacterium]|jgi:ribosomal-protein-serine acetyltransferase|nr:GNAT family N-acetyltransferase [Bacteroidales bacterium]
MSNQNQTLTIDTEIQLRPLELNDYQDIFNTIDSQRKYLGQWLPFVKFTRQPKDSKDFVEMTINQPEDRFESVFTIRYENQFAGLIGFKGTDRQNKKTEIGYWLSEKLQGKGIVTKSVKRLCDFAFQELGLNRIQIKCAVGNEKSKSIPKRLGFIWEGIERDGELLSGNMFTDIATYSKLKREHIE